jgi:tRNA(fMet)-specific endonuclease VapC
MRYLLDTNAVIAILNDSQSKVADRLRQETPADVAVSAIVLHELYYGAFKSRRVIQNVAFVDALQFVVLEFDKEDSRCAGMVRASLAAVGTPIGPYDVLIAGQALYRNMVLVTRNLGEFARVATLQIEDWES